MARRNHFKSTVQKKYRSQSFANPFFRKKHVVPWKGIAISGVCAVFIVAGILYLLMGERFDIREISITGLEHISTYAFEQTIEEYLAEGSFLVFSTSNAFLFNSEDLTEKISQQFLFADVNISKQGTLIHITVNERTSNLIWESADILYIVDTEGVVVRKATDSDLVGELPHFVDENDIDVEIGSTVMAAEEIEGTFLFHEHLSAQGVLFYDTHVDRLAGKWVSIETIDDYRILFDPTGDIDEQAHRLEAVMKNEIDDPGSLEYIDLRFGDHVYFK